MIQTDLFFFKDYYHIFYQYYPYGAYWGPMHWGHARSKDLVAWENLPVALIPGDPEDKDGCFSGSAIVKDERLYLLYTGNNYYDKDDPEHFWQNQNIAYSDDGINFTKYEKNPVIPTPPKGNTQHFRDPKMWKHGDKYYVIIGSQNEQGVGRVLTYRSNDLLSWEYLGPIAEAHNADSEGYMWECPDIFTLDGEDVLLCSPQGIKPQGEKYLNLHNTGYFVGKLDYEQNRLSRNNFTELDHGHNFYATQTMLTPDGRRVVFGWMAMWESDMPEQADGWSGALTLPRELKLQNDHLYMNPVKEVEQLREETSFDQTLSVLESTIDVNDPQHTELNLNADLVIWAGNEFKLSLKVAAKEVLALTFDKQNNHFVLKRTGEDPYRYGSVSNADELKIRAFLDTSSVEIFINDGELVFSERYYVEEAPSITLSADRELEVAVKAYSMQ